MEGRIDEKARAYVESARVREYFAALIKRGLIFSERGGKKGEEKVHVNGQ